MIKSKFKLIPIFFALTLFNYTTNISAMENKTEKENIKNKIFENKQNSEEKYNELKNVNISILGYIDKFKNLIYYFKKIPFTKDAVAYTKQGYEIEKNAIKILKKNYEEIINSNIAKNKETKKIINEISFNIKDIEKYIKIIDEKFKNFRNQNKIYENNKIADEEINLKYLKDEIEKSFELNKKYFFSYVNSISLIKPIKELKNNKIIFEKSCKETINLIKKFDDINTNSFNNIEIKEEIKKLIEGFLTFYFSTNEYIFYSFLKRFKETNPNNSEIDQNFATKYNSITDVLESKTKNIEELNIPKIESFLNDIKINEFNLPNKFLLDKKKLSPLYCEPRKEKLEELKKNLENFNNKYNETKDAFLTHTINEAILKNPFNDNFEINKKFMYSLSDKDYFTLHDNLNPLYKKCNDIFNFLNYKQYNIFDLTKKEIDDMKNNYLKQYLNAYKFDLDSSLKLALDGFYESFPQKENEDEDEFFSKNAMNNFFKNFSDAKEKCYKLNRKILSINHHNKREEDLEKREKKLENYTMLLRGYDKDPFLNLLTQNLKDDKKILESLKFKSKLNSYETKIKFFLNEINTFMCLVFNKVYILNINKILNLKVTINQDITKKIITKQEDLFKELKVLLKECKNYIYITSKKLIEKNKENKTEIYEEKILKKQIYIILKFIENIEKKGFERILKMLEETLNSINNQLDIAQYNIIKNQAMNLTNPQKLKSFLLEHGIRNFSIFFKRYINYSANIPNDKDFNLLYEKSLKQIEEENI